MRVAWAKVRPAMRLPASRSASAGNGSVAILTLTLVKLYVCLANASLR
jgi:hypothetical protein